MSVGFQPVETQQTILPAADWSDCWSTVLARQDLTAPVITRHMLGCFPLWIQALMRLRNTLTGLLGLKPAGGGAEGGIGGFPVISENDRQVVLGLDDRHLDFRILIDVKNANLHQGEDAGVQVSVTTLVERHNVFGKLYIVIVTPFHRVIVRRALSSLDSLLPMDALPGNT